MLGVTLVRRRAHGHGVPPGPTPALVQQATGQTLLSTTASSLAVPLSSLPTLPAVGNTLFMIAFTNATTIAVTGATDPETGNTWSVDQSSDVAAGSLALLRCPIEHAYGSGDSITLNFASGVSANNGGAVLMEAADVGALDVKASNGNSTVATSLDCGTTAATAQASELVIAAVLGSDTMGGGSGWSTGINGLTSFGTKPYGRWGYKVSSTVEIEHPVFTVGTARKWTGLVAAYKAAA